MTRCNYLIGSILFGLTLILWAPVSADNVYVWTDSDGVKHYSDQEPPETVNDFQVIKGGIKSSTPSEATERKARQEYDQMMQQVRKENRRADLERRSRELQRKKDLEKKEKERKQAAIKAERDRLQSKIDALKQRALSPTFTQGMRQAQIDAIQEEMNKLNGASDQKQ